MSHLQEVGLLLNMHLEYLLRGAQHTGMSTLAVDQVMLILHLVVLLELQIGEPMQKKGMCENLKGRLQVTAKDAAVTMILCQDPSVHTQNWLLLILYFLLAFL